VSADAGIEGADAPGLDAPPIDGGGAPDVPPPPDTGVVCASPEARCEGEILVTCADGLFMRDDCGARAAYCETTGCVPQACAPNAVSCDGIEETRCDPRGTAATTSGCPRGCTAAVGCNPQTACSLTVQGTVGVGVSRVDTCGAGDDSVFNDDCTRVIRSGPDVIARLEVPVRANYRIELRRIISGTDPVLYIRTACADGASELACNDDAFSSTFSSRIDITLDPGDYFLMLDTFRDDDEVLEERCGMMDISVEIR